MVDWSVFVGVVVEIYVCVGDGVVVVVEKEEDRVVGWELICFIGGCVFMFGWLFCDVYFD